jgi:exosortase
MTRVAGRTVAGAALVTGGLLVVYWHVFRRLVEAWIGDGNYSHGFLILPLAAYFAWERRAALAAASVRGSWLGLATFGGAVLLLLAGLLGSELFLTRVSLLVAIAGIVLFLFGWAHLRILTFPLAFLLLMIPIPSIIFNQVAFPLQLFASRVGESAIAAANIPVLREGNIIVLASTSLEVAEACSGIRSLISLLTLGIVYGYFVDPRGWVRLAIALSTIPVAILANGARVAGTGMAAHWFGAEAADGFFHDFSGWALFAVAFVLMLIVQQVITRLAPRQRETAEGRGAATVRSGARAGEPS